MDLNKPISLPKIGSAKEAAGASSSRFSRGKDVYPTKTTINLVTDTSLSKGNTVYTVLAFAAAVVLIGLFCKFCVVDPLMSVASVDAQVRQQEAMLAQLESANANYGDVSSQYERYVVKDMTPEESAQVLRTDVFRLLDAYFNGVGSLLSVAVSNNALTVTLLGADMSDVSRIVEQLENDSRVMHVTVTTAQGKDTTATSATITILFQDAGTIAADSTSTNNVTSHASAGSATASSVKGGN